MQCASVKGLLYAILLEILKMRGLLFMQQTTRRFTQVGALQVGIIVTTLITAGIHLYLSSKPDEDLRTWFFFNGLGYLLLLAGLYLPQLARFQHIARLALIGFAILTIILWIALADHRSLDPLDAVTKTDEIILLVLLFFEERSSHMSAYR